MVWESGYVDLASAQTLRIARERTSYCQERTPVWCSPKAKPVSIRAARQLHPGTRILWRRYCGASYLEDDRLWRVLPAGRKVSASCERL